MRTPLVAFFAAPILVAFTLAACGSESALPGPDDPDGGSDKTSKDPGSNHAKTPDGGGGNDDPGPGPGPGPNGQPDAGGNGDPDAGNNGDPDAGNGTPDAGFDAGPTDPGYITTCDGRTGWFNVLKNRGFEQGPSVGWVQDPVTPTSIKKQGSEPLPHGPYEGSYFALLGNYADAYQALYQDVQIPANVTQVRLRGHKCFSTEETTPGKDFFDVALWTLAGKGVAILDLYSNEDAQATCTWESFTSPTESIASHAGTTVRLKLLTTQNDTKFTSFSMDSLSLEVNCP